MKISIIGTGYVGLSLATLISVKHDVVAVDIVPEKIEMINKRQSPISDREIEEYFQNKKLKLRATHDIKEIEGSKYVIIATPTNYDPETNFFNTKSVESVIKEIQQYCNDVTIIIKSTVPIGFTEKMSNEYNAKNILFSPEFLREGKALYDNLHPSRIIIGVPNKFYNKEKAVEFANILESCAAENNIKKLIIGSNEAESVKLFSNTYLAMRVAFFNELDTFAASYNLKSEEIINGVCMDPRIGDWYNNPSFGYGGYCLPKDTKQLLANYENIPHTLIGAIIQSNYDRKIFISNEIKNMIKPSSTIGIYRLIMKSGSDNFRESSILDIMKWLGNDGFNILIYEPMIKTEYQGFEVETNIQSFKKRCDIILANRMSKELENIKEKVYCRDLFGNE